MNYRARRIVTIDIETLPSLSPAEVEGRARKGGKDSDDHARTAQKAGKSHKKRRRR